MLPAGLFITLLVYFYMGSMTSVPGGDSSMFIGASYSGGVAQPPGYPFITLIYKFLHLFPGDSTHLINFSSGLFNACASLILFFLFKEILNCSYNAIALSALFSFMPLIFRYGIVAEVFALNNLLISAVLFLTFKFQQTRKI